MTRPDVGDPAPRFEMTADDGSVVSSDRLSGSRFVLYFYPKDDTPGCSTQACSLRDAWSELAATGAQIFGVSPDSLARHIRFRKKFDLPFPLLSDEGHRAADAYGVWVEKTFAGRTYFGTERTTFVIGTDGRIEHVLARVKPEAHAAQLIEVLAT